MGSSGKKGNGPSEQIRVLDASTQRAPRQSDRVYSRGKVTTGHMVFTFKEKHDPKTGETTHRVRVTASDPHGKCTGKRPAQRCTRHA
jgi:hypothetical protein